MGNRRKRSIAWLACLSLLLGLLGVPGGATLLGGQAHRAEAAAVGSFSFVHVTDTHVGSAEGNRNTPRVVEEILALPQKPAFLLHGGDITELGTTDQYDAYLRMVAPLKQAGVALRHTPGNHDARWADAGKAEFRKRFGAPYSSFDYQGIHFVLLDVSVSAATHGHLDRAMLTWLGDDLRRVGTETPVVVVSHHPIAYEPSRFLDNDEDFLAVIRPYNVRAVFTGHGHLNLKWKRNGVAYFMTAAGMDAGYKLVQVENGALQVYNRVAGGQPQLEETVPLARPSAEPRVQIVAPADGTDLSSGAPLGDAGLTLAAELRNFPAAPAKVEYRLDLGKWRPLQAVGGNSPSARWVASIPAADLNSGLRSLQVRVEDGAGNVWTDRVRLRTAQGVAQVLWRFQTGGSIQGTPAVADGTVYAGSYDGTVYAVAAEGGAQRWTFGTGAPIVGGAVVEGNTVYIGSTNGVLYALQAQTGDLKWSYLLGGAIVATPQVAGDTVYIGSTDGNLYALSTRDGSLRWKFAAGGAIRAGVAYGDGAVYVGAWDRKAYAIDAQTGAKRWEAELARSYYYSPANTTPLFYQGKVIFTTSSDSRNGNYGVHALDARTGAIAWRVAEAAGYATPVLFNRLVLVSTTAGKAVAIDPATGAVKWSVASGVGTYDSSPVPFGGDVVMGSLAGRLISLNGGKQAVNWFAALGDNLIFARPAVQGKTVYLGSMDGGLYAFTGPQNEAPAAPPEQPQQPPAQDLPPVQNPPGGVVSSFRDVQGHWAAADIERLRASGLTSGYADGTFKPQNPISRAELAVLLARYLDRTKPSDGFQTRLIDMRGHWARDAVAALEERGIIKGYTAVNGYLFFSPDKPISRAEAAVLMARVLGVTAPPAAYDGNFADLEGHWAKNEVLALAEKGIVRGTARPGGSGSAAAVTVFRPADQITRAEAAALIARMIALKTGQ